MPCLALDDILPRDRQIGLIKIDVEGSELHALRGLQKAIRHDHPVIVSEFNTELIEVTNYGAEYLDFLLGYNYDIRVIESDGSEIKLRRGSGPCNGGISRMHAGTERKGQHRQSCVRRRTGLARQLGLSRP